MNLRSVLATLLIVSLIGSLFACRSEENQIEAVFTGQGFMLRFNTESNPLNLTSRANIYDFIQSNPGTHFRKICTGLGISIGSVQYHLEQLTENKLIESEKESKYKRFFISRRFSEFEKRLLAYLQKPNAKMIIKYTSAFEGCSHQELARLLGISSQAVTWHVKRLMNEKIIESGERENMTFYWITDKTREAILDLEHQF